MRLYRRFDGGPWWCDFWHAGRRVRKSTGTAERQAAQEWADRLKAGLWRAGRLGERPAVTWDEAVIDWVETHADLRALADRKDALRWASKYLAGKPLAAIDRHELDGLAKKKAGTGVKPATVNRHLAAVSAVLRHALVKGWVAAVPPMPRRQEPAKRVAWATEEEAAKLVAALPPHWAAMAEFALATGLRRANVTGLRWQNVDLKRAVAWVHADEAKAARVLSVPLNDAALAVLRRQRDQHPRIVFPFQGRAVERCGWRQWRAACKAAGLPAGFRWHDLRHTWASWHIMNGTPPAVLKELGGWHSLAMVERYAHLARSHVASYAHNAGLAPNRVRNRAQLTVVASAPKAARTEGKRKVGRAV